MLELVFGNLRARPFRTLISTIGVAIGVILIVLFTGLAKGMTEDIARRTANWKAEIVFTRPGGMDATSSNTAVNVAYAQKLLEIDGVESTVPVIRYVMPDTKGSWGIKQVEGVDWEPFAQMNGMTLVAGRAPQALDEVIVDQREAESNNLHVRDTSQLFGNKPYKIVGIYSPPSGARTKMSLAAMQDALQTPGKCTYILIKLKDGADPEKVGAKIDEALPGNRINLTRDIVIDATERIPGLNTFLRVLVGLGALVSTIFVLLCMYTTITERRKEIGILKSLGASSGFIIGTIEGEALLIGVLGIVLGFATAWIASTLISARFDLTFSFSRGWILTAVIIAIGGSLFGALYPAWRAAGIDPVEVMVNE
ncbi:MAG: ABC transporter permease [Pyrinomonadaceae bacterium]